jgi:hypothetical protein
MNSLDTQEAIRRYMRSQEYSRPINVPKHWGEDLTIPGHMPQDVTVPTDPSSGLPPSGFANPFQAQFHDKIGKIAQGLTPQSLTAHNYTENPYPSFREMGIPEDQRKEVLYGSLAGLYSLIGEPGEERINIPKFHPDQLPGIGFLSPEAKQAYNMYYPDTYNMRAGNVEFHLPIHKSITDYGFIPSTKSDVEMAKLSPSSLGSLSAWLGVGKDPSIKVGYSVHPSLVGSFLQNIKTKVFGLSKEEQLAASRAAAMQKLLRSVRQRTELPPPETTPRGSEIGYGYKVVDDPETTPRGSEIGYGYKEPTDIFKDWEPSFEEPPDIFNGLDDPEYANGYDPDDYDYDDEGDRW